MRFDPAAVVVPSMVLRDVHVPLGITRWPPAVIMCKLSHLVVTFFSLDAIDPLITE